VETVKSSYLMLFVAGQFCLQVGSFLAPAYFNMKTNEKVIVELEVSIHLMHVTYVNGLQISNASSFDW
jgi:hypothetical protein